MCIEYKLDEIEALHFLLQKHARSDGLNAFSRILLALDLKACFKEKGRENQGVGGRLKGSSNLTEADRMDTRQKMADAAGACPANVSKVQDLLITAQPEILEARIDKSFPGRQGDIKE